MGQVLGCLHPCDQRAANCKAPAATAQVLVSACHAGGAGPPATATAATATAATASTAAPSPPQQPATAASVEHSNADKVTAPLGQAARLGAPYLVECSGPPRPPCWELGCEQESQLAAMATAAPRDELQTILRLVCSIFKTNNALIAVFFDQRVYVIDAVGQFREGDFPWRYSMCGWTLASEQHSVMVVNDVLQDARFCNSPVAQQLGVRFYAGAPLVSSAGLRMGTLCFADSSPRVFDDHSLKILCNFSELVTRELERDLALAQQQQRQQSLQPQPCPNQLTKQYQVLLRTIDCVSSAVLLIDTSKPGWLTLYANRGVQQLLECCQQVSATAKWVLGLQDTEASNATANQNLAGKPLWPLIEAQLLQEQVGAAGAAGPAGAAGAAEQSGAEKVKELVKNKESFTLRGVQLEGCAKPLSMTFRCAGLSDMEGAVNICLPTFVPDEDSLAAHADALAKGGDGSAVQQMSADWQSLYMVTVQLQTGSTASLTQREVCSSESSSTVKGTAVAAGHGSGKTHHQLVLSPSIHPHFPGRLPLGAHAAAAVTAVGGSDTVVISSVACTPRREPSMGFTSNNSGDGYSTACSASCSSRSGPLNSLSSFSSGTASRAVCNKIEGLQLGCQIAAGSYGRVYKGCYFGTKVAVKVLDDDAVLRREASTGVCLEALLGQQLKHPNIVCTLAWAVVTGKDRLPHAPKIWGETLDPGKPSIAQNRAAISHANAAAGSQLDAATAAAAAAAADNDGGGDGLGHFANQATVEATAAAAAGFSGRAEEDEHLNAGQTWMVLEYCDHGCLQDAVDRGWLRDGAQGPVNIIKVLATAFEIAMGMHLLHQADVVHGDLSAFNVLLSRCDPAASVGGRGFVVKISDFGLSRLLVGDKMVTKTYGTITHQPPELLEHGICSKAADVYSFGVLLWQMVCSSRAWAGMSHQAVVHAVCIQKLQLVFPDDAPEALVMLGRACMSHDPEERPTFRDVLDILEPFTCVMEEGGEGDGVCGDEGEAAYSGSMEEQLLAG